MSLLCKCLDALQLSQEFTERYSSEHCKYLIYWAKKIPFLKYKRCFGVND
jgi:hypothetical protein